MNRNRKNLKNQLCLTPIFISLFFSPISSSFSFDEKSIIVETPSQFNCSEKQSALPTFNQILDSIEVRFKKIKDYKVNIDVVMDVKGIHIPPMLVTVFYKQPDKLHFESRGFAVFPKNAVMFSPTQFSQDDIVGEVLAIENIDQINTYHLMVKPPVEDKNIEIKIDFWVDVKNWIIIKIRTESNRFGWMEINNQFQKIGNEYWLLQKSYITMEIQKDALTKFRTQMPMDPESRRNITSSILDDFFGTGQMYITFRNYKVNEGIPDEFFEKK